MWEGKSSQPEGGDGDGDGDGSETDRGMVRGMEFWNGCRDAGVSLSNLHLFLHSFPFRSEGRRTHTHIVLGSGFLLPCGKEKENGARRASFRTGPTGCR